MTIDDPVARKLLAEDAGFQRLWAQHQEYERQLAELDRIHHLLPQQEVDRRTIQKRKLAGKDAMAAMIREASGR